MANENKKKYIFMIANLNIVNNLLDFFLPLKLPHL